MGRTTYRWKALDESYNFALDCIAIQGLLAKLWGSKVTGVPFGAISGLPNGSLGKNSHLDVASVESCRVYYKGEGGGFPQVRAMVSFVCPCCLWFVLAPRVLQLCTNHFVWVVCKLLWVSEACQLFLVPSRSSNTPLYPSKCCELGSVLRLLLLLLFSYLGSHLSPLPSSAVFLLGLTFEPSSFFCCFPTWAHIWALWGVGSASCCISCVLLCIWKQTTILSNIILVPNANYATWYRKGICAIQIKLQALTSGCLGICKM